MTTRREVLVTGIGTALAAATAAPAPAQPARKTFVLVHGAWGGGWVWRRVADLLEARGHKVYTPTLTGLGERSHLLDAKVNLSTHITDTVNVIKWERLDNIVLVGHSYAGMVITGVAGQAEHTIGSIVYLDAFLPDDGQSLTESVPQPQIGRGGEGRIDDASSFRRILCRERKGPRLGGCPVDASSRGHDDRKSDWRGGARSHRAESLRAGHRSARPALHCRPGQDFSRTRLGASMKRQAGILS